MVESIWEKYVTALEGVMVPAVRNVSGEKAAADLTKYYESASKFNVGDATHQLAQVYVDVADSALNSPPKTPPVPESAKANIPQK